MEAHNCTADHIWRSSNKMGMQSIELESPNFDEINAYVRGPHAIMLLNRTSIFEWCMVRLVVKNNHQYDTHISSRLDYVLNINQSF